MSNQVSSWAIDSAHSKVGFKVKHLMISNVQGHFNEFEGTMETNGDDLSTAKVNFSINAASIDTSVADRDAHLRSADFFDAENFPKITFVSSELKPLDDDLYQLKGTLSIKGVEKEVTLEAEYGGVASDPWGNVKSGFTVTGKINRKDWGLTWNAALETGGVLVGDDIKLSADIELTKVQ